MARENHDYATELLGQCVIGDPSNLIYVQNYIGNLQRKYNNNKTGSKLAQFKERGARSAVKKASSHAQWDEVITHGLKVLTVNPWDVHTLTSMATAASNMGDDEPELYYLKCALEANPKDPDVNRQCAMALAERRQYDQAIACWRRVEKERPGDEQAEREVGRLLVEKTIDRGKYEDADESKKLGGDRKARPQDPQRELSMEEQLQRRIDKQPEDLSNYFELAQLHLNAENYAAAEEVLATAYEVSEGDPDVREKWQDVEVRRLRQQIARTEDEAARKKLIADHDQKDLEIHQSRCERYPQNFSFKYELGRRYQRVKQYNEAIREFQQARNDLSRKGRCMLHLGQCFQEIKQYRLAMNHYESAIEEIPERDVENRKESFYLAGKMALALKDLEKADKHLTQLAEVDFTYKDVSALMDKIAQLRQNEENPG